MTEDTGELGDILFQFVEGSCRQIAGKHLVGINVSLLAQGFHFPPYVCAVDRLARFRDKDSFCFDVPLGGVSGQLFL